MPSTVSPQASSARMVPPPPRPLSSRINAPKADIQDTFERSTSPVGTELTWLGPALAQASSEAKSPTAWTYLKGAGKVVGGFASVILTIGALGLLALLQPSQSSANPKPKD